ncbi:MAG: DNA-processing protein DprA, partial [Desulfobulbaceae bacterium]|nr:DNA-processing protein DprA [Desulfobulbaceae bacterium]
MEILEEWLTLYLTPGLGSGGCRHLVDHFGSPAAVLQASPQDLQKVPGRISKKGCAAIGRRETRLAAKKELQRAASAGVEIICRDDDDFPEWLLNIPDPPLILYVKGRTAALNSPGIGIVGSRAASTYGLKMAEDLARQLARQGLTVISGLALGIDAAAHRGALRARGNTVAVLGCGLDVIYPAANRKLFEAIPDHGAIVSEYPLGTRPDSFRFPARNRIISGLGLGVVVVEAAQRSGSLITAAHALDQGREVFAVPGRADSIKSTGTHRLLQAGAKLVLNINDITSELIHLGITDNSKKPAVKSTMPAAAEELNPEEKKILAQLEVYPKSVDDVIVATNLAAERVSELLL